MEPQEQRSPCLARCRPAVFRLHDYVAGYTIDLAERELGLDNVVKLAQNENPWGTSPRALAAIAAELPNLWQYPERTFLDLTQAIARAHDVTPAQVVVGHGSEVIVQIIPQLLCEPGDDVILADLTYGRFAEASKLMDARLVTVPLRDFRWDVERVCAAAGPRTKVVWLCSPHNPTGSALSRDEVLTLLENLPPATTVVLDQAYQDFVDDPAAVDGVDLVRQGHENLIVLRTFSKAYGLAGMRLGYGIGPEPLVSILGNVKEPFNVNRLSLIAGPAALEDREWLRGVVERTIAGRQFLSRSLSELGFRVVPSQANFVLFEVLEDSSSLWRRLLQRGVIIRPGTDWGLEGWMRVSVGTRAQNERFLAALRLESRLVAGEG